MMISLIVPTWPEYTTRSAAVGLARGLSFMVRAVKPVL